MHGGRRRGPAARRRARGARRAARSARRGAVDRRPRERVAELDAAVPERDEARALLGRREVGDASPGTRRARARAGRRVSLAAASTSSARASAPAAPRRGARSLARRCRDGTGASSGSVGEARVAGASSSSASGLPAVARVERGRPRAAPAEQQRRGVFAVQPAEPSVGSCAPSSSDGSPSRTASDDGDRVGDQPAHREQQRVGARAVEPVRVVDEHRDRRLLGVAPRAG